jgi:DivIVA domain-containing protein
VDREEIERPGFPVGRRGYDQDAVDAHLRRVADEFERMRDRPAAPARGSLSAGTSEQVRVILEAAERSAAELRDDAGRRAAGHVERVGEAADGMLRRLEELQTELGALLDGLRQSGERLADGLAGLQERVADVDPAPAVPDAGEPPVDDEDFAAAAPPPEPPPAPKPRARRARRSAAASQAPADGAPPPDDEAGARIIALNMALGGSPREETAAYLDEHFTLADPEALLDDVYARAGG